LLLSAESPNFSQLQYPP